VFCCEVEAIFNTLLDDEKLLQLLFSLLDQPPPLSCKTAGYFGRVVGQLLLRKTNEMMQYMSNNESILERFMRQVDTTSIADVLKRLVGADDQSSMLFLPMHTQWLTETPLVEMLLARLGPEYSSDVQANAADILTAIAHTQPSFLATQLMQPKAIASLFQRALEPDSKVLVAALDVCAALLEPMRSQQDQVADGSPGMGSSAGGSMSKPRAEAVATMLEYVPQLVEHMRTPADAAARQETPYGLLAPPLGRARLKAIELLAALLRVGDEAADNALISTNAIPLVQELFVAYPFNNLLHHQMLELLLAALRRAYPHMVEHLFGPSCQLLKWLRDAPKEVVPEARPGGNVKGPLRAGYLGHITKMSNILVELGQAKSSVGEQLAADPLWAGYVTGDLLARNEQEDVNRWACGRPSNMEMNAMDSDGDDFQVNCGVQFMSVALHG
jgi:serine/threonine-protein phosphatase 6 regulatory subunit 3